MADQIRTSANNPASPAASACAQWETLLADALDGVLRPEDEGFFATHRAECAQCAALYEEARQGREWLDFLSTEPELPAGLMEKILAATGPGVESGLESSQTAGSSWPPALLLPAMVGGVGVPWQRPAYKPGFMGLVRRMAEPRLMMTAAMAFFSIALTLSMTGVKVAELRPQMFRPTALRSYMERQFALASTPVIRYYDHLRLVNEMQMRIKELRGAPGLNQGPSANPEQNPAGGNGESERKPAQKPAQKDWHREGEFLESAVETKGGAAHMFGARGKGRSSGWIA